MYNNNAPHEFAMRPKNWTNEPTATSIT